VHLTQLTLAAGIFAATLLQFVGALQVRLYARSLWVKEIREEERARALLIERCEGGLAVIFEEDGDEKNAV